MGGGKVRGELTGSRGESGPKLSAVEGRPLPERPMLWTERKAQSQDRLEMLPSEAMNKDRRGRDKREAHLDS